LETKIVVAQKAQELFTRIYDWNNEGPEMLATTNARNTGLEADVSIGRLLSYRGDKDIASETRMVCE